MGFKDSNYIANNVTPPYVNFNLGEVEEEVLLTGRTVFSC